MATPAPLQEPPIFSLVLEGPLHRILRRAHLSGSAPQLLSSLAAISILVCWVPLAVLSLVQAHLLGGIKLSFIRDIETHVRFLVSLPLLILTEMLVRQRVWDVARNFVERKVVPPEESPKFCAALNSGARIHRQFTGHRDCAFCFCVHRWYVDLATSDYTGCRQLVCLGSRGTGAFYDGRLLACVRECSVLPVLPVALVCAVPDLLLVFISSFASSS